MSRAVDDSLNLESPTVHVKAHVGTSVGDVLASDAGNGDWLLGGLGNDTYQVINTGDQVLETPGGGDDSVWAYLASYTLPSNVEGLVLGQGAHMGIGNELNNVIVGNDDDNILIGMGGGDTLIGGKGDDFYVLESLSDKIVEEADGGIDTEFRLDFETNISPNVEGLTLLPGALTANGNPFFNYLVGTEDANFLNGGGGDDVLVGRGGTDTFVFVDEFGHDVVTDFQPGAAGDVMLFRANQLGGFAEIMQHALDDGEGNTIIDLNADHSIALLGVTVAQLTADNFYFI
jgi:Ca2+-binding RTX toxin-like protein